MKTITFKFKGFFNKLHFQATGMVISNSLAINNSLSGFPRPGSASKDPEMSHVTSTPKSPVVSPSANKANTPVADRLAALGISSNVDYSEPVAKPLPSPTPPHKPTADDDEDFQPVAPAPGKTLLLVFSLHSP